MRDSTCHCNCCECHTNGMLKFGLKLLAISHSAGGGVIFNNRTICIFWWDIFQKCHSNADDWSLCQWSGSCMLNAKFGNHETLYIACHVLIHVGFTHVLISIHIAFHHLWTPIFKTKVKCMISVACRLKENSNSFQHPKLHCNCWNYQWQVETIKMVTSISIKFTLQTNKQILCINESLINNENCINNSQNVEAIKTKSKQIHKV